MNMPSIPHEEVIGRKTLILGDINTGKTTLTRNLLIGLCDRGLGDQIVVIDLAPEIPGKIAAERGLPGAGGKLLPPEGFNVLYLTGHFLAPRLTSKTEKEAIEKARRNRRRIGGLFRRLKGSPRRILMVNDISMALQAGTAGSLIRALAQGTTIVANGYWGERLGGGTLTAREKAGMQELRSYFEKEGRILVLERSLQS
jgi:hypothetical protein